MIRGLARGAAAGAAGTTALNAATYLDMAVRGRPTSDTPEQLVEKAADSAGVTIPGEGETRDNRLAGLGPLSGALVGTLVGALSGAVHEFGLKHNKLLPPPVSIVLIGGAAMLLADLPLKLFGVSDPADWAAKDWAADALPHFVYGAVTYATLVATDPK